MSQTMNHRTRTEESAPVASRAPDSREAGIDAGAGDNKAPEPVDSPTISRSRHRARLLRRTAVAILMVSIGVASLAISERPEFAVPPPALEAEGEGPYQVMSDPGPVVAAHQAAVNANGEDSNHVPTWVRSSSCTRVERSSGYVDASGECLRDHPAFGDDITRCAGHFCAARPGELGAYLFHPSDFGPTS